MQLSNGTELRLWSADLFPAEHAGARRECRFAGNANCGEAEFAERMGGENLGGYARWMPLCTVHAERRFSPVDLERVRAAE